MIPFCSFCTLGTLKLFKVRNKINFTAMLILKEAFGLILKNFRKDSKKLVSAYVRF
jgi:hypothetical protein